MTQYGPGGDEGYNYDVIGDGDIIEDFNVSALNFTQGADPVGAKVLISIC